MYNNRIISIHSTVTNNTRIRLYITYVYMHKTIQVLVLNYYTLSNYMQMRPISYIVYEQYIYIIYHGGRLSRQSSAMIVFPHEYTDTTTTIEEVGESASHSGHGGRPPCSGMWGIKKTQTICWYITIIGNEVMNNWQMKKDGLTDAGKPFFMMEPRSLLLRIIRRGFGFS